MLLKTSILSIADNVSSVATLPMAPSASSNGAHGIKVSIMFF